MYSHTVFYFTQISRISRNGCIAKARSLSAMPSASIRMAHASVTMRASVRSV